jgi:hypothetical protein
MSEDAAIYAKRARKLSDKALHATDTATAPQSKKARAGNFVIFKKNNNGATVPLRGSIFALPAPTQHNFEAKILPSVALSLYDKASQLKLCPDQLICYGCEVRQIVRFLNICPL